MPGPEIVHRGKIDATTMAVYDVAPTLYEFAGIDATKALAKKPVLPMVGVSFKRYMTGETLQPPRSRYGVELHNQAAWIDGDWKLRRLVKTFPQAGDAPWGLFNLKQDPLETHDLATQYPQRVQTMSQDYAAFAGRTMVVHTPMAKPSTMSASTRKPAATSRWIRRP